MCKRCGRAPTLRYTAGRTWKQAAGRDVFCNNYPYVTEGDTLYMLESVGPVSAAGAGDVDASNARWCSFDPCRTDEIHVENATDISGLLCDLSGGFFTACTTSNAVHTVKVLNIWEDSLAGAAARNAAACLCCTGRIKLTGPLNKFNIQCTTEYDAVVTGIGTVDQLSYGECAQSTA